MKTYNNIFFMMATLVLVLTLMSCEKTIEIALPEYDSEMVVECYLQNGQPAKMALTRSVGYFENPQFPEVINAIVTINGPANSLSMDYGPAPDLTTGKSFNYSTSQELALVPGETYDIVIEDEMGNLVTGTTRVLPEVPIKSHSVSYSSSSKFASIEIRFDDDQAMDNYYRVEVLRDSSGILVPEFTILYADTFEEQEEVVFTIGGEFEEGAIVIINLYHLEKDYYEFLRSVEEAEDSNGNPFGQPARIKSAVNGGLGIFTNLAFDTEIVVIE